MLARIANAVRAALSRLRAGVAACWWEMVEVVEDGVRLVRAVLRMGTPAAPPELEMEAAEVVAEPSPVDALKPAVAEARSRAPLSEGERVRLAARSLHEGRRIDPDHLNPELAGDLEVLVWLADLPAIDLGVLAKADPKSIEAHLAGRPMPFVRAFTPRDGVPDPDGAEAMSVAVDADPDVLDERGWYEFLVAELLDLGDDDPDHEALEARARIYAAERLTVAEYRERWPILIDDGVEP